jgi:peptidyl-prolyl cis-trans isomerase D
MGGTPALIRALPGMNKGETTELMEIGGKFYLFQVEDKKPSSLPHYKDVKVKVKQDFISSKAVEEAKKAGEAFLEEVKAGKKWEESASSRKLKPEETGFFSRREPMGKIGNVAELKEAAFGLTEAAPYPDKVFDNDKGAYAIRLIGRKAFDPEKYEKEREQFRSAVVSAKKERLFRTWLAELRSDSKIEILNPNLLSE